MSAHVVEDKTINRIVSWIFNETHFETSVLKEHIRKVLAEIDYSPDAEDFVIRLGNAMFDLNVRSVDARYGKGEAEKFRPLSYEFKQIKPGSLFQILKSINCWLYQCSTPVEAAYCPGQRRTLPCLRQRHRDLLCAP